jgi:HEAT repeat protein
MRALEKEALPAKPEDEEGGETIEELLAQLHSHEWKLRERARWQLETQGEMAVFPLMDALEDPDWHVRWEAAKALRDIADPRAAPGLVRSLRDRRFGVRWLASDALIALKEAGLPALLNALVHHGDSVLLRAGAHHVLRDLSRGHVSRDIAAVLKPVIAALESMEPSVAAPVAARKALEELPARVRRKAAL